jgi:ABC-type transport system involved in multi-copper enzyme maturation permease subunit
MIGNPIIDRELVGTLRSRRALAMQLVPAVIFAALVLVRWPTDALVGMSSSQSYEVFRLFGYGLLATLIILVPIFPATSVVREKRSGTLALLLNSPMSPWSIYFGKLAGVLGVAMLPLVMSIPAAAAVYAMGGISLTGKLIPLYAVLLLATVQYAALGLLVSCKANSVDAALRINFALVLALAVVALAPHQLLQGKGTLLSLAADWLRSLSPIPALLEILGQSGLSSHGVINAGGAPARYWLIAGLTSIGMMLYTIAQLKPTMFDRARPAGVMTDDQSLAVRSRRRIFFLVDPQRRKGSIGNWTNPVLVKEFRSRRFGRSHWMLRLIAGCAVVSMLITFVAATGTLNWEVKTIGGMMVMLQVALIVLLTPSLAAGLISGERESGGWTLLKMTPLSAVRIVSGKLLSAVWTLLLILFATLPGYLVMIYIQPVLTQQVLYVLASLLLTAVFALLLSAAISSLFRRTATATVTAYAFLVGICGGTLLFWAGRDAPFGHRVVEAALTINPIAAALSIMEVRGFTDYELVPANWWFVGGASIVCLVVLMVQTWRLTKPD